MVKAGDSWIFQYPRAWKPPDQNGTETSIEPKKCGLVTYVNSGSPDSPSLARIPGFPVSGISDLKFHQKDASIGSIRHLGSQFQAFPPSLNPYLKESMSLVSHEPDGKNPTLVSQGNRFIVFDQSAKGTRLIYGSPRPMLFQESNVPAKKPCDNFTVDEGKHSTNSTQLDLNNPIFLEESGENQVDGEGSEMHEETDEINALLYSDDDDDDDFHKEEDGDEEDEVTSKLHAPSVLVQCYGKHDQVEDRFDRVGNFGHVNKWQKLTGGEYNFLHSSPMETPPVNFGRSNEHESDAGSSFVMSQAKEESGELSKKDKIRQMMKILEGIVPGVEGKDPVIVLDDAIEYLKAMKLKAKVLGMSFH